MVVMDIKPFNPDTPNHKVINAIRHEATPDFQSRIPAATQADVQETLRQLQNYRPAWNEFVSAIVNKVGLTIARNNNWSNPLAKYKRGLLEYGDTIEEIHTGLVEAYVYDSDRDYGEQAIFGQERPEVQADYHKINRENFYKITVKRPILLRAFQSETGLATFINQLMDAPTTSDNWDEYLLMREMFAQYEQNGGFFKIHVDAVTDQNTSFNALESMRATADRLKFISRRYNAAHMPVSAQPDQLTLFTTPEFKAKLDVKGLAALFNVEYGEVPYKITVIDDFGIPDVQAILTTDDFFVVADTYYETTSIANPVGLHENFFLHHHQIISASRFVPAVAFTTGEGTDVTTVDPPVTAIEGLAILNADGSTATETERGMSYEIAGSAVTTPEGGVRDAIRLSLEGVESVRTYVSQTRVLHVAADELSTSITVNAVSTDDETVTATTSATVTGEIVTLWPNPRVEVDADNDGLIDRTPKVPVQSGNTVTIPDSTGIQYQVASANVANGSTHEVDAVDGLTVTAVARAGSEIASGATASWSFTAE